ncbi:MAG: Nif3-like dinuclear metal center hexameric protein [Bacteroidota bacterium]
MNIQEFQKEFEKIAPPSIAWKGDNIGLLIGRPSDRITNILVALDLTMDVAREAKRKKANCIITHHPLLFHPLKNITPTSRTGEVVLFLTENKMNVYAAHTNLDSVQWGVNFVLAKKLGLTDLKILSPIKESLVSIVVFVPSTHVEQVADAMHCAGAGSFTKYDRCSFRADGTGTFRGNERSSPFIGTRGTLERVQEIRLETISELWNVGKVVTAMLKAHPYEEVAYDLIPLLNKNSEYGLGAIGVLPKPVTQKEFLGNIKQALGLKALKFSGKSSSVRTVAVCGGSGSEFIGDAVAQGADAMVTADLKYHTFQEFESKLLLVDAGHYETEHLVLPVLVKKIQQIAKRNGHSGKVFLTQQSTNPVHIF